MYEKLPVGKYPVGFSIITITDSSRENIPAYNYLGEENGGDRFRKITIHLWYPAKANSGKNLVIFRDYCYNNLLTSTNEILDTIQQNALVAGRRRSVEGWFGKTTDGDWNKLIGTQMLGRKDALPDDHQFPLLIGMLRPLSTSITNELLASNGFVVAMINAENFSSFSQAALPCVPDMQYAIAYLGKKRYADMENIGAFGFSGSGFLPVYLAMYDGRVRALADIESGIYMDQLYQAFSISNYYVPSKLKIPFLHIFSLDLSKQEKYIEDFERKTNFSERYRLLINQPALHHWDFATEGYSSCFFLNNRGSEKNNIMQSFEIASLYLVNFFAAELKNEQQAIKFMETKPSLVPIASTQWSISVLKADKPAPDKDEFAYIIRKKGISEALNIAHQTLPNDTLAVIRQGYVLNTLGYTFLNEGKYAEAIGIFILNTELHPDEANFFDSLAEAYEVSGNKEQMKKTASQVLKLLNNKANLTDGEKLLKIENQKRLQSS